MIKKFLLFVSLLVSLIVLAGNVAEKIGPHYDMWEKYGKEFRVPRRAAERFFKKNPKRTTPLAASQLVGIKRDGFTFMVNRNNGQPEVFTLGNSRNLVANDAVNYPFWTLTFRDKSNLKEDKVYPCEAKFAGAEVIGNKLILTWEHFAAKVKVSVDFDGKKDAAFKIEVKNLTDYAKLVAVDFPRMAFAVPGDGKECMVTIPWRRGRLLPLTGFISPGIQEYPGSSGRFQLVSFYNKAEQKDGVYIYSDDNRALDKHFAEAYNPVYNVFTCRQTFFPADRGKIGNHAAAEFATHIGTFDGDWYDAAQIYRQWWQKQKYASRGPVWQNPDVPEFLKQAPLWLRFYTRLKLGLTAEKALEIGKAWHEFLPQTVFPATHYHFAVFSEKYPVYAAAEYYGFNAEIFPGLQDVVKKFTEMNIRTNVFLQSEIINQYHPENGVLKNSASLDEFGKMRTYDGGWQLSCRLEKVWQKRFLAMTDYLLSKGFHGLYMDTYGKVRSGKECFADNHGHDAGGGNANNQRPLGKLVRKHIKAVNRDFYIGGEASCEFTVDILDYKLNATNGYNDLIPLERALYGDYIISHGRVIRGNDVLTDNRLIAQDFIEGIIPGRFFAPPPKDEQGRRFISDIVKLTKLALEYNRLGKLLRPLKFSSAPGKVKIAETKTTIPVWQNNCFRSYRDNSVGIIAAAFEPGMQKNSLIIDDKVRKEWDLPENAEIIRIYPDGRKEKIANLKECTEIPLTLNGVDVAFLIIK